MQGLPDRHSTGPSVVLKCDTSTHLALQLCLRLCSQLMSLDSGCKRNTQLKQNFDDCLPEEGP